MDKILLFDILKQNHDSICAAHNSRINGLRKSGTICFGIIIIIIFIIVFMTLAFPSNSHIPLKTFTEAIIELTRRPFFYPLTILVSIRFSCHAGIKYYHGKLIRQHHNFQLLAIKIFQQSPIAEDTTTEDIPQNLLPAQNNNTIKPGFFKSMKAAIMSWLAL